VKCDCADGYDPFTREKSTTASVKHPLLRYEAKLSISSDGKSRSRLERGCGADSLLSESRAMVDLPHRGGWSLRNHTAGHRSETIKVQLDSLPKLNRTELREGWRDSYGSDPPEKISELLMQQAIAHRLQLKYLGGLNFSTRRTLKRVLEESGATHPNPRSRSKSITIGTVLVRQWHGATHQVTATEKGMLYRGKIFRSLSEVARKITGTRWSGPLFFGLRTSSGESKHGTK
jgi:hypothetical protein